MYQILNFEKIHQINIPIDDMDVVYKILDPETYIRFFERKDNLTLEEKLKQEEERCKNILALTLLFKKIKATKYTNNVCSLKLNLLLTYELYISISHHINTYHKIIEDYNLEMENCEFLSEEYNKLSKKMKGLLPIVDRLQDANYKIVEKIQPEILYALSVCYRNLSVEEHAEKCLI